MKKFIYKNTSSTYISELPEYKLPSVKYVAKDVWDKITAFIKRAGSVILICSIIIWTLSIKIEGSLMLQALVLIDFQMKILNCIRMVFWE